ncbi:MAG TPA: ankyrin repeat domain-containing protein [Candidatus Acidoferrales bacterium]|nr:ankyrin repeat domain-containing protein [Candidatus Acidoferrales bacterium]
MTLYESIGGAEGCRKLSAAFYTRVARDPVLKPIFPKSFHCAIPAFAAYLSQFLGGGSEYAERRWYLSLREAHARFKIGSREREAWLERMSEALDDVQAPEPARGSLRAFFEKSSRWLIGEPEAAGGALHSELERQWHSQRALEETVAAVRATIQNPGEATRAIALAGGPAVRSCFERDPVSLPGLLAVMCSSRDAKLLDFVRQMLTTHPELLAQRHAYGRTLLHDAADAGNLQVVEWLLELGADPNATDGGGHAPLYGVGNACTAETGAAVVHALVRAGAQVGAQDGVQRTTALHMAARRGNVQVAEALLDCGADIEARDRGGATPLRRAINCRKKAMADFLRARGGRPKKPAG